MTESNVGIDLEYYRTNLDFDNEEHLEAFKKLEQLVQSQSESQDLVEKKELVDVDDRFWNTVPEKHYTQAPLAVESYRQFKEYTSKCWSEMFDASAIEQVLLLAKNARGPASVVDLISGALARPDLFVFGELLDLAVIRQLRDESEVQPWYAALELFAYGTWNDFISCPESFPNLSDLQKRKLKQLTAVTTVQGQKITTYTTLKADLGFEDVRDLEDFLINHCFYSGVIQGRIDQEKGLVVVSGSIKRDVRVQDFSELKSRLESWVLASERCLEDVLNRIVFTREAVEKTQAKREQLLTESEKRMQEIKDSDGMVIDEQFTVIRGGPSINDEIREFKTRRANQYP